jgi:hypothetical protein
MGSDHALEDTMTPIIPGWEEIQQRARDEVWREERTVKALEKIADALSRIAYMTENPL